MGANCEDNQFNRIQNQKVMKQLKKQVQNDINLQHLIIDFI